MPKYRSVHDVDSVTALVRCRDALKDILRTPSNEIRESDQITAANNALESADHALRAFTKGMRSIMISSEVKWTGFLMVQGYYQEHNSGVMTEYGLRAERNLTPDNIERTDKAVREMVEEIYEALEHAHNARQSPSKFIDVSKTDSTNR